MSSRFARLGLLAAAAAFFAALGAGAQEGKGTFAVSRLISADGTDTRAADLMKVSELYAKTRERLRRSVTALRARVDTAKANGHESGVLACSIRRERTVRLEEVVPPRFREMTLYLVRAQTGGIRPAILPASLPKGSEVFVLGAASIADVAALSRTLGRPLSLAGKEFAHALGVTCSNARVVFSPDGKEATVLEVRP